MTARVLIVDDEPANLWLLEQQLSDAYFDVLKASSGPQALELAEKENPDIILLDVRMLGMDGFETCRAIKANQRLTHIPVVMVTAVDDSQARVAALEAGADDYLIKPVREVELFARMRALTRLKMLLDEWRARESGDGLLRLEDLDPAPDSHLSILLPVAEETKATRALAERLAAHGEVKIIPMQATLAQVHAAACDIIVISLTQPIVEGLRLVARLRSSPETRHLLILGVVEGDDSEPMVRGFELGINDCIDSHADALEISVRLRTLLRRKRLADLMRANVHLSLRLATTDAVTGLYNRHYMAHRLENLLRESARTNKPMSLMMIDVDHFKRINDNFGHAAGDKALAGLAHCISNALRGIDLTGRFGGEEFIVIMPETDLTQAQQIAERLRERIANQLFDLGDGVTQHITVSIGIAGTDSSGLAYTADQLIHAADTGLYAAKNAGRNCIIVASLKEAA